jgi:HK97 family phage prohead protease
MAFKKTFVVSTEDINSYGFWVPTLGIDLSNAENNCPAFFNHRTWEIPLGHWVNIRKEGGKLLADLIIDGKSDAEREYIRKIENGDIKGASVGLDPIVWDSTATLLKQGQTSETLTKSSLFEISITPLPSNQSSLALKHRGSLIALDAENVSNIIPLLKLDTNMKAIALKLGLAETATEAEILAKIGEIQLSKKASEDITDALLKDAEVGLTDEAKEIFITLSKNNPSQALKYANSQKQIITKGEPADTAVVKKDVTITSLIKKGTATATKDEGKETYDYLQKYNPVELQRIHKEEPEKYAQMAKYYANGIRYKE